jgi:hypothetical protein
MGFETEWAPPSGLSRPGGDPDRSVKGDLIDGGGTADDQVKIAPFDARLVAGLQGVGRPSATTGLVAAATGEPNSRSLRRQKPFHS